MAVTTPTNVDTAIPEIWAARVMRVLLRDAFWSRFAGGVGSGMPIIQQTEILNKPGDLIHIQTTGALVGAGVSGDTSALVSNEEALSTSEMKVAPLLYRHAVRVNRRANKKAIVDLREEARMRLSEWGLTKVDNKRFAQFSSVTNADIPEGAGYDQPNTYTVGGGFNTGAAAGNFGPAAVAAGEKLTVAELQKLRYHLSNQNASPFKVEGMPFYALVVEPAVAYHLKQDTSYSNYLRDAAPRGMDNPLFTGAVAMIDGIVIFQHFNTVTATDGAASLRVARNLAFGAEAFVEGWDENVSWAEDTFDYDLEWGVAYAFAFQARRALEKNSMIVYSDATLPA